MACVTLSVVVAGADGLFASERRFDAAQTIAQLRTRLEPITGVPRTTQTLRFLRGTEVVACVASNSDGDMELGSLPLSDYMTLEVSAPGAAATLAQLVDTSLVAKYEMPDTSYDLRRDSVREFKRRNKLGRFADPDPNYTPKRPELDPRIHVGARCAIDGSLHATISATVLHDPENSGAGKWWVAVELDEPRSGSHDFEGTARRIGLEVPPTTRIGYRMAVRDRRVVVGGDYPVQDVLGDDFEEM